MQPRYRCLFLAACTPVLAALAPSLPGQSCSNLGFHRGIERLQPSGTATHTAVRDGAWSDPTTWSPSLPGADARVLVPAGVTLTVDLAETPRLRSIRVEGTMTWRTDVSTRLRVDTLFSLPSGRIEIGTPTQPIAPSVTAEIVILDNGPLDTTRDPEQLGRGLVLHGPTRIAGSTKLHAIPLARDRSAGSSELILALPSGTPPPGWQPGDRIVVSGTRYDERGTDDDDSRFHDEVLTVTSIQGNRIRFVDERRPGPGNDRLRFDHRRPASAQSARLKIWVANLSRNVVIRSENPRVPIAQRGHVMLMHTPDVVVENALFLDLGRSDKTRNVDDPVVNMDGSPGFGTNPRGRYGLHLHRNLPQGGGTLAPGCTPALVRGVVVWGSPGWGLVHHDSHAILEENVVFDVVGSGIVAEAGNEVGAWRRNLAIKIRGDDLDRHMEINPRLARFDFGFNGEGYWLQGAPRIVFEDNVAASCGGTGLAIFGHADAIQNRDRTEIPTAHLEPEFRNLVENGTGLDLCRAPLSRIHGFEAANCHTGILTWMHMRNDDGLAGFVGPGSAIHRVRSRIERFVLWGIYGQGIHTQYTTQLDFVDGILIGDPQDPTPVRLADDGAGRGLGVSQNPPAQNLRYERLWIEGFARGFRVPESGRPFDMLGGTLRPSPIPRSRIREVHFENVGAAFVRKSVPWVPATPFPDHFEVDGLTTAALSRPNAAPTASFRWQATGDRGVFRLDASNSRDPDPDPALEIAGNGIVAYGWDLDGDDRIDAFGREALCRVEPAGMSKITLYVWDHQGQQAVSTQKIGEASAEYGELLVDPELQLSEPVPSAWMLDTGSADQGWCGSGEIRAQAGRLILEGSPHGQFSVGQIVLDRQERIGPQRLEWVAMHRGGGGRPNLATIEVWGVDGEFRADYWGGAPQPLGTIPHRATRLASIQVPPSGSRWLHESAVVDFSDGFEFILIQVFGTGFEASAGDQLRLERVSIIGEGG